jgi:hypothetical protein
MLKWLIAGVFIIILLFGLSSPVVPDVEDNPIIPVDVPPTIPIVYPPPPTEPQTGKRLGLWLQWLSELQSVPVNEFVQEYFFEEPYFAALELIMAVWHPAYPTFITWVDGVASAVDAYPIEIYVMLALDMADQNHWNLLESALIQWQDNPSIYSVGVNGEHSKLHYPNSYDYAGFTRFQILTHQYDKRFISYYSQNAPSDAAKRDFQWIAHVNWPFLGHRVSLESSFDSGTWQAGISAGLYDTNPRGYPDPNQPHINPEFTETDWVGYNRASIQYMLQIGFMHDHSERRCLIFAQLGLWNSDVFRSDIREVSEGYEIITSIE